MKFKFNRKDRLFQRVIANTIVVVIGVFTFFVLQNFSAVWAKVVRVLSIFSPFFIGFIFAYLLNAPVNFFENKVFKFLGRGRMRAGLKRGISILLTLICVFIVLGLLAFLFIPQLIDSIMVLTQNIKTYTDNLMTMAHNLLLNLNIDPAIMDDLTLSSEGIIKSISDFLIDSGPAIISLLGSFTTGLTSVLVGIVISVYLLFGKENYARQIKKLLYAHFSRVKVDRTLEIAGMSDRTFIGFLSGKLLDSLIIGVLSFIGCWLLRMPYPLLISVIIGVTNILPFFGPIIGAVPSVFIVLIADPGKAIWLLVFIIALQQFDGNILGPKILGDTTGLPAIWVLFSIIIGGGLFGFWGMLLGVPVFAVLYTLFRAYLDNRLLGRDLPDEIREDLAIEKPEEPD